MWISIETWVCGNKSYPQLGNGKQKGVYVYNGILFNSRKKQNNDSCPNMEDTKTVWQMKVVTCKKLHIIWFQLYDISKNKQKKSKFIETENRPPVRAWGWRWEWGLTTYNLKGILEGMEMLKKNWTIPVVAQLCKVTKWYIHLQWVKFMVCSLYLKKL